jgi:hypothetical protein
MALLTATAAVVEQSHGEVGGGLMVTAMAVMLGLP